MKRRITALILAMALLCALLPLTSVSAGSNTSIATATSISFGNTYSGEITSSATSQFYKMTLSSSGKIALTAAINMHYCTIYLYNENSKQIWYKSYYENSTTGRIDISESIDLTKGTYYLCFKDTYYTGNYSFSVSFSSANESFSEGQGGNNNSIPSASVISSGNKYYGQIALNDTTDFYKLTLSSSGKIALTAAINMHYCTIYLYDENSKEIWSKYYYENSTTGRIDISESIDLTKGTYYLCFKDTYYTGNYSFSVSFSSANESFSEGQGGNNNSIPSASVISSGNKYYGQIALNDNTDFYKLTLSSSGKITLTATVNFYHCDIYLYDENSKQIWYEIYYENSTTGRIDISESIDLTKGTYYLCFKDTYYTGNYSFSVSFSSANESFSEGQGGNNNSIPSASVISSGNKYYGQIALNDNTDFYKLTLSSSGKIALTAAINMHYCTIYLYDENSKQIWYKSYYENSTTGQSDVSESIDLTKGTYYLCFKDTYYTEIIASR